MLNIIFIPVTKGLIESIEASDDPILAVRRGVYDVSTALSYYHNYSLPPCLYLCTFATKIREGIIITGKMTATLKLKNDSPIEMT
jgi:hypothetical protein